MPDPDQFTPLEEQWQTFDHTTQNPDGVTVSNVDYTPKTLEEKAALIDAPFAGTLAIEPTQPYPDGSPPDLRQWVLDQAHTKQEQVEEKDRWRQDTENLKAGGQLANGAPVG